MSNEDVWKAWQAAAFESLVQSLCSLAHFQGVLSTWRDKEMINDKRVDLFIAAVVFNKNSDMADCNCYSKTH